MNAPQKFRLGKCLSVLLIFTTSTAIGETIATARGTNIPLSMVDHKITAPLTPGMTVQQFQARLQDGGTLSLSGGDLVIAPPDFHNTTVTFLALDLLELKDHARIITNGNTLVIFTNKLNSEDGSIIAFRDADKRARNGDNSQPGDPGVPGGLVSLHVIQTLTGILHTDLGGQNGGNGGNGSIGSVGSTGQAGQDATWTLINCNNPGQNGGDGGQGGIGGAGADGGAGGHGGILELFNIGNAPIPATSYTFAADGGKGGGPGIGGPGGPGGQGGLGGSGGGPCGGGTHGQTGPQGHQGPAGHAGEDSAAGHAVVKNINLQQAVQDIGRPAIQSIGHQ